MVGVVLTWNIFMLSLTRFVDAIVYPVSNMQGTKLHFKIGTKIADVTFNDIVSNKCKILILIFKQFGLVLC